ncbi:MAG TPA: hypothetical protein VF329_15805 [Gammaproteobacteria bacterium]
MCKTARGLHPRFARLSALILMAAPFLASLARAEPAVGQFELKTLESAPGRFEFQSQNAWSWGQPQRRSAVGPEGVVFDENTVIRARHALELEIGFTDRLKSRIGVEFEKERVDEPETIDRANDFESMRLEELGAELIVVLVPREADGVGLGLVFEIEQPVDQDETSRFILGPIIEYRAGRWFAAAIPVFVRAFGGEAEEGEQFDDKWDFAYAAQLRYTLLNRWALALEGYGTVERLGDTGHRSEAARLFGDFDQHRLGPVLYYTTGLGRGSDAEVTIGLGLLEGLNGNTPDHTLKLSIEVDF